MSPIETWFAPPLGTAFALVSMVAYRVLAGRPTSLVASAGVALVLGFTGFGRFVVHGGLAFGKLVRTEIIGVAPVTVGVDFALAATGVVSVGFAYWLFRDPQQSDTRPGLLSALLVAVGVSTLVAEAVNAAFPIGPFRRIIIQKDVASWISVISILSGGLVAWGATARGLLRRLRGERSGPWGRDDSH